MTVDHQREKKRADILSKKTYKNIQAQLSAQIKLALTHCANGHLFDEQTTYISPRGRRECRICRKSARLRFETKLPSEGQVRTLLTELNDGVPLGRLIYGKRRLNGVKISCKRLLWPGQLAVLKAKSPRLGRIITGLAETNATAAISERARAVAAARLLLKEVEQKTRVVGFSAIITATEDLPDDVREDVRQDMLVAAFERRLKVGEVQSRLGDFVAARRRMFSKFVPVVGGIMRSLDQPIYDDGSTRLVDMVSHGLWQ